MARKIHEATSGTPNSLSLGATAHAARTASHRKSVRHHVVRTTLTRDEARARRGDRHSRKSGKPPSLAGRGRAASGINKSAFVRSLPGSLSAAEVIEKGKAKGIKLSAAQVYTIRANARRKGPEKPTARLIRGGAAPARSARGRAGEAKEAEFIAAALDLGLARAEALIRALRAKASAGWS